jgi:hypothetical protein
MAFFWALRCSSWLPGILGAEVDDIWDNSWRGNFALWLYLTPKPSHVGVDVDGLAYPPRWSTVHSCQMRGYGLLPGAILSCHCSGRWRLLGDVKPPLPV